MPCSFGSRRCPGLGVISRSPFGPLRWSCWLLMLSLVLLIIYLPSVHQPHVTLSLRLEMCCDVVWRLWLLLWSLHRIRIVNTYSCAIHAKRREPVRQVHSRTGKEYIFKDLQTPVSRESLGGLSHKYIHVNLSNPYNPYEGISSII